jgi:hypothetical protein
MRDVSLRQMSRVQLQQILTSIAKLAGVPIENFERFVDELLESANHVRMLRMLFIAVSVASSEITETLTLWQDNFAVERDLIAHAERWLAIRERRETWIHCLQNSRCRMLAIT